MTKTLIAIGASATGVLAIGLTVATHAASARTTPLCSATLLRPAFASSQGAAGTLQDTWRVTNLGHTTCHLSGFPVVNNYRSDGRPLPMSVSHTGTPHTVTLTSGQHARFSLRYTNPGAIGCTGENPAHMTIQVPGTTRPVIANNGTHACHGQMAETPLVHG
jgi:hypothetical protein